ncbi:MAG: DUF1015 family protein [Nocardioides sp.]|uniref:DUF1015 family protein n=1 Tax=Nocardioides sp. TaxID=35761 RepID=UPI0039E48573
MDTGDVVTPPYVAGPLHLAPFSALFLNPRRLGDPASARLYARPYRGVAARMRQWTERGDIVEDVGPALYLHEYTSGGMTVRGVVGSLDISRRAPSVAESCVLPHEGVKLAQAGELGRRMGQMQVNPAPILLTQSSPPATRDLLEGVMRQPALQNFDDRGGQHHRIWAIRDTELIERLNREWAPTQAMIADGHHRYAAYLRIQSDEPGGPTDHGLAMLIDHDATPMHLGAIHRIFGGLKMGHLERAARELKLDWRFSHRRDALGRLSPGTLVLTGQRRWATLDLPGQRQQSAVEYLHSALLPRLPRAPRSTGYAHSVDEALGKVRGGDVAVLLPAPSISEVWRAAADGRLLPEKATSFQPKPHPGGIIRSLRSSQQVG